AALEAAEAFHDGMSRLGDRCAKGAGFRALKLGADQLDVLRRMEEAVRGAMQRNESLTASDEIEQCFLLLGRDPGGVRVDNQAIVLGQQRRIKGIDLVGVR